METTALLVEIVIVGFGFFLSLVPALTIATGVPPLDVLCFYASVPLVFQLAASYAAGVFWNRVCDQVFHPLDGKIVRSRFSSRDEYQAARIEAVVEGKSIRDYLANYRSLIRISRASSVLLFVYLVASPLWVGTLPPLAELPAFRKLALLVLELGLLSASVYAWYHLQRGYVSAVSDAHHAIVRKHSESAKRLRPKDKEAPDDGGKGARS